MAETISKQDIVQKFSESVGAEKAAALVDEALAVLQMSSQTIFDKEEVLKLFDKLKEKGGMIKIIAGFLAAEAHLMNL